MVEPDTRRRRRQVPEEPGVGGRERGQGLETALSAEADARLRRIQQAAYFKSERRAFAPGREMDDWLDAEREDDESHPQSPAD